MDGGSMLALGSRAGDVREECTHAIPWQPRQVKTLMHIPLHIRRSGKRARRRIVKIIVIPGMIVVCFLCSGSLSNIHYYFPQHSKVTSGGNQHVTVLPPYLVMNPLQRKCVRGNHLR